MLLSVCVNSKETGQNAVEVTSAVYGWWCTLNQIVTVTASLYGIGHGLLLNSVTLMLLPASGLVREILREGMQMSPKIAPKRRLKLQKC